MFRNVPRAPHPPRSQDLPSPDWRLDRFASLANLILFFPQKRFSIYLGCLVYIFGDPAFVSDPKKELTLRVHDECNGSDVFGSDVRSPLHLGLELLLTLDVIDLHLPALPIVRH